MSQLLDLMATAEQAVAHAGNVVKASANFDRTFSKKGDRDFATDVDFAVEDEVRRFLATETPQIPLLGEERGHSGKLDSTFEWVIDPIDGTVNFTHDSPLYSISLALMRNGRPVVGVVACPGLSELYSAAEGHGATVNGEVRAPGKAKTLGEALVSIGDFAVGTGSAERNVERFQILQHLVPRVQRIRMIGSAALDLCWVATGRLDATVILSTHLWDIGAGVVIAQEAGMTVGDRSGAKIDADSTSAVACLAGLQTELLEAINSPLNPSR